MSLRIVKQGVFDSIQDLGRFGFQHIGINPGGAMDPVASSIANVLVGNEMYEAAIEMHFPASSILFTQDTIIALSGADFTATLNDHEIPINKPVIVKKFSILLFTKQAAGARCYLAVKGGFMLDQWLNSNNTNLKAKSGGFKGRCLMKDDELSFRNNEDYSSVLQKTDCLALPWSADVTSFYPSDNMIRISEGTQFKQLTDSSKEFLLSSTFTIASQSDRMGYRLEGQPLELMINEELVSSAVNIGTIQLFPNGQLIILMADHQTTGGYPRMAHIISCDLPQLAQQSPGSPIRFQMISHSKAEKLLLLQNHNLRALQQACSIQLKEYLQHHGID